MASAALIIALSAWAMCVLMGMAFEYFAYRFGMPLSIRSALYPLINKRIRGLAGDAVDTAAWRSFWTPLS